MREVEVLNLVGRCAWCWNTFQWAWTPSGYPRMFCSKGHADRARAASKKIRDSRPVGACATPGKKPYLTREAAMGTVREAPTKHLGIMIYECSCGFFHLGRIRRREGALGAAR